MRHGPAHLPTPCASLCPFSGQTRKRLSFLSAGHAHSPEPGASAVPAPGPAPCLACGPAHRPRSLCRRPTCAWSRHFALKRRRLETRSFLLSTAEAATGPGLGSGPGRRAGASNEWRRGPAGSALGTQVQGAGSPSAPAGGRVAVSGRRLGNAARRPSASPPPLLPPSLLSCPGPRGLGLARGLGATPLLAPMLSPDYGTYGWAAKQASNSVITDSQSDRASNFNLTGLANRGHFYTTPKRCFYATQEFTQQRLREDFDVIFRYSALKRFSPIYYINDRFSFILMLKQFGCLAFCKKQKKCGMGIWDMRKRDF